VNPVFADTFYWIALLNPSDRNFQEALHFDALLSGGIVYTTEEVLTEVPAFPTGDTWLRNNAVETVREILSDDAVHVIPRSFYAARPDKGYSLTDCISMQTMRREGLTDVLTYDRHFEQEGFRALFRA
jgi:uncharacterized protein